MIRRAGAILVMLAVLASPLVPAKVSAQDRPAARPPAERRVERKPANIPFLFSAFALTWIAVWLYLVVVHRGQRRLEKTLERMEAGRP